VPADDYQERTEQPTPRRREEARQRGNVARSVDLTAAGHMVAVAAALSLLGGGLFTSLGQLVQQYLEQPRWLQLDRHTLLREFWHLGQWSASAVLPLLLFLLAAAFFVNVVQVGFLFAPEAVRPKLVRLNPIEGAKRLLSLSSLVRLAVNLLKLVVLCAVAGLFVTQWLPRLVGLVDTDPYAVASSIGRAVVSLAFFLSLALLALGVLDLGYQKWKYERDLRMTKEELREELKNMEGDPLIRQRRREAHRKLAQARELQAVRDADVVITNPTHIAVALKYDPETMPAPTVVAKGMGPIAERIRQIAAEHGVPIIERKELARVLYRTLRVGQPIPVELYEVFVEIMAYVYRITGRTPPGLQ